MFSAEPGPRSRGRERESDKFVERPDLLSIGTSSHVSDPPPPWPIIQCYMLHYSDAPSLSCNALQSNAMNVCLRQYKEPYSRIECLFSISVFVCACMWVSGWGKGGGTTALDSQYLKIRPLLCSTSWKICGKIILRVINLPELLKLLKNFLLCNFCETRMEFDRKGEFKLGES